MEHFLINSLFYIRSLFLLFFVAFPRDWKVTQDLQVNRASKVIKWVRMFIIYSKAHNNRRDRGGGEDATHNLLLWPCSVKGAYSSPVLLCVPHLSSPLLSSPLSSFSKSSEPPYLLAPLLWVYCCLCLIRVMANVIGLCLPFFSRWWLGMEQNTNTLFRKAQIMWWKQIILLNKGKK